MRRVLLAGLAMLLCGCAAVSQLRHGGRSTEAATVLAQLDSLAVPDGADPLQFGRLKSALRNALLKAGAPRFTSAVPAGLSGTVDNLSITGDANVIELGWTYRNRGDYDQNSEANITDLSPLGLHFGKTSARPDWAAAQAADGDGNGEVNLGDITPIGVNFFGKVEGYVVQESLTPAVEASWTQTGLLVFNQGSASDPGSALLQFEAALATPPNGMSYRVLPFSDGQLGPPSNVVQFSTATPEILSVEPVSGAGGSTVTFSAQLAGGTPEVFSWDFGGGASPNTSSLASPTVVLGAEGSYSASLTVSNASGSDAFGFALQVSLVNAQPVASFTATPQTGLPGEAVVLDAAESTDSDGVIIKYEWDLDGDAAFEINNGVVQTQNTTLPNPPGSIDVSLRVTDTAGGTDTATVTLISTGGADPPPVASFTATPQTGSPGEPVVLDAAGSSDPGGTIVKFEWDLDGNGSFELDNGASATTNTTLPSPSGSVVVGLRVTDNAGGSDTATLTLTSAGAGDWVIEDIDINIGVVDLLSRTSLAIINGNPAVCYYTGALKYARAANADGTSWNNPATVFAAGDVGAHCSLAQVNGRPAISFSDISGTDTDVLYVRALDGLGHSDADWDIPVDVAPDGTHTSLVVLANDLPAISYVEDTITFTSPFFRLAGDANGDTWGGPVAIEPSDDPGRGEWNSLRVVAGNPAVTYLDRFSDVLKYARATDDAGIDPWADPVILDGTQDFAFTSLAVVAGIPAVSYYEFTSGELRYLRADDAVGSSWNAQPLTLDGVGDDSGIFTSLAVIGGIPCISYASNENGDLKFVRASDAQGNSWGQPETVDEGFAFFTSLAEVNGKPGITWIDGSNENAGILRFAVFAP